MMWELRPTRGGNPSTPDSWWLPGAGAAAAWLLAHVQPGARMVLRATPSPAVAALIQGAWAAGICLVPINRRLTDAEAAPLIARAGAALVVDDRVLFGSGVEFTGTAAPPPFAHDPAHLALLLFTSGTSGPPKAVRLSRRALSAAVTAAVERLNLDPHATWSVCLPLDHIGGISIILRSLFSGCSLHLHERFEPNAVAADLSCVSGISLVPTMLHRLVQLQQERGENWPPSVRTLLIGGGPLDRGLAEACTALGRAPCQTYGLTECASQVCTLTPDDALAGIGTAGRPLSGMEVRLTTDGLIQVRGAAMFDGYDAESFPGDADGWFTTGDCGQWDAAGRLMVLGRGDDVLISGGENCAPHEIEAVLERHPGIREAGVYGLPDREWGMRICAVLVPTNAPLTEAEVRAACELLAAFKRPKEWRWASSLPRTSLGKIQRQRLRFS